MITASRLELAQLCLYAFRDDIEHHGDTPKKNEFANRGTNIHNRIAEYLMCQGNFNIFDMSQPDYLVFAMWANAIGDGLLDAAKENSKIQLLPEISYACNIKEDDYDVMILGHNLGRDYPTHYDFAGTADLVVVNDDKCDLWEWKTGQESNVTSVVENWQMRSLAALVDKAHGPFEQINLNLVFLSEDKCVTRKTTVQNFSHRYMFLPMMQKIKSQLKEHPAPILGLHCTQKYCSMMRYCPAQANNFRLFDEDTKRWIYG